MTVAIFSIDEQVAAMKAAWPQFAARRIDRRAQSARWVGSVRPQYASYSLEIRYEVGAFPEVRVLSPELVRLPGNSEGQLPHVYPPTEDPTLCLFDPREREWTAAMTIASTTVPWALDWLACLLRTLGDDRALDRRRAPRRTGDRRGKGDNTMNYVPPRRSDGTIQHARLKQPWPQGRPFRILSIDGGGIRGVFPAAVLAELESRFLGGASITNHFDMIASTSTGGIIALALAHGMTAQQALNIYLERGERIFPPAAGLGRVSRALRWLFKPKHNQAALKEELLRIFGDKVLDDAVTRLVIPSFEGRHGEPFLYKTPHHPDYQKDRHKKFAHVALHTTAAPSYYPGVEDDGYIMIDGGIWANNPVMSALVDALACFDIAREDVRILSLGTGESTFTVDEQARNGGIKDWAFLRSFNAAARAQSRNALGQAYLLVGKNNVTRIDVPESDAPIAMDDVQRSVRELPMVARSLVEGAGHHIERVFLDGAVEQFIRCPMT